MKMAGMRKLGLSFAGGIVLIASCGGGAEESGWKTLSQDALSETQTAQRSKAVAAREAMFGELMKRVSTEIDASGPTGAIHICREAAPEIARSVAEEHGVQIGRTSWKLRNPENRAPAWAESLLADRPEQECLAGGPDGQLGVTLPLRVMAPCLQCHGTPETLAAEVRQTLAESYPEDEALGYHAGDLRGWFWIEVPAEGG